MSYPKEQGVWSLGLKNGYLGAHSLAWGWGTLVMGCGGPRDLGKVRRARWRLKNVRKEKCLGKQGGATQSYGSNQNFGGVLRRLSLQGCH